MILLGKRIFFDIGIKQIGYFNPLNTADNARNQPLHFLRITIFKSVWSFLNIREAIRFL